MKFSPFFVLLLFTGTLLGTEPASDPKDMFLNAFSLVQKAERLQQSKSLDEAAKFYKEADERLKEIRTKFPEWNPAIVEYRQKRVAEALKNLSSAEL